MRDDVQKSGQVMRFGSLFSGAGGIDLGLERAGFECAFQVEIDSFCQKVLAKHWPDVRRWDDVRTFPPDDGHDYSVDLIAGGFPCQDISKSNASGKGLDGERSGLWWEYHRIIRTLRPRYVIVENVPAIFVRGFDRLLGSLAEIGYDAEWQVLSAGQFGAPHIRERLFLVAYPQRSGLERQREVRATPDVHPPEPECATARVKELRSDCRQGWKRAGTSESEVLPQRNREDHTKERSNGFVFFPRSVFTDELPGESEYWRQDQPNFLRMDDGLSAALDKHQQRIKALGNAVVPAVAQWIGERIMSMESSHA